MSMTPRCMSTLALVTVAVISTAQTLPLELDFGTSDQWANCFTNVRNGTIFWTANHDGYVWANTSSSNPNVRYDTDPGDPATRDTFRLETVAADFWHSLPPANNPFFSLYARVQSNNKGILATVQFVDASTLQLRLSYGADMVSGSLGTYFYQATFTLTDPPSVAHTVGTGGTAYANTAPVSTWSNSGTAWTTIHRMRLVLEQTGADAIALTLSDAQGLIATSGLQALAPRTDLGHAEDTVAPYRTAGSVGFRMSGGSYNVRWGFDNFAIVPPPPAMTMITIQ